MTEAPKSSIPVFCDCGAVDVAVYNTAGALESMPFVDVPPRAACPAANVECFEARGGRCGRARGTVSMGDVGPYPPAAGGRPVREQPAFWPLDEA